MVSLSAVLLAAGASRRMGQPKALLPFGSSTIVECILDKLLTLPFGEITVVLGHEADRIQAAIGERPVRIALNDEYERGMLSSLRVGLRSLSSSSGGAMIHLVDQPHLPQPVLAKLFGDFTEHDREILVPVHGSRRGHPLVLSSRFYEEVNHLPDDRGLRELLKRHPEAIRELQVEAPEILRDIDDRVDYQREISGIPHG